MPEFVVYDFLFIAVATGKPKSDKIKKIINRTKYNPNQDYYGAMRTSIKFLFTGKRHISHLYDIARKRKGSKKVNYEKVATTFNNWQSGKNISAYKALREEYLYQQTKIICNPELNVTINGIPTLVKLHMSQKDKMTQERANIICHLMKKAVGSEEYNYLVLDLITGKEYYFNGNSNALSTRIENEIELIQNQLN